MQSSHNAVLFQTAARIISQRTLSPGYYHLTLLAPEIAAAAQPGQFAQLRPAEPDSVDPLLARPISIFRATPATGEVEFIYKVVGRGTASFIKRRRGETLTVIGPIGNGFVVPDEVESLALIAGGVGMPPLYFLAARLRQARPTLSIQLFYGGRSRPDLLCLPEWDALLSEPVFTATDDGTYGHHGRVTDPFVAELSRRGFGFVAACGPRPMLAAVQQIALAKHIPGQLSLEERMACGVGACLGCVCETVFGKRRICIDGPVFAISEVRFHA